MFLFHSNLGSYYSPGSYSKSINCDEESDLEENLADDENCFMKKCNKKIANCKSKTALQNPNSTSNSSFDYSTTTNLFPVNQTNVNFLNAISDMSTSTPPIVAVAQAITSSNDILTTNCSPLSKNNSLEQSNNSLSSTVNSTMMNGLEQNLTSSANTMISPIDKLYSMQSSYFNLSSDCENCVQTN